MYMTASGASYEGEWADGVRHGKGVEMSAEGDRENVKFVKGVK